jgi:SAM-dependent methyltransferase
MPDWSRFTAAAPDGEALPTDVVTYGPDIPTEAELRLLGHVEGKRVLDLGCGSGRALVALARQGARAIGVDPAADQLASARRAAEEAEVKVELHQGPLADLAFLRADTIDLAISVHAFAEVDDLDRVFRQVHRVLKSESHLVFSVPHPAFAMVDAAAEEPFRVARSYFDHTPRTWIRGGSPVTDHPATISDLFTSLGRANFRVDTLLEPEPTVGTPRGAHWSEAMRSVPATLIVRARKQGI